MHQYPHQLVALFPSSPQVVYGVIHDHRVGSGSPFRWLAGEDRIDLFKPLETYKRLEGNQVALREPCRFFHLVCFPTSQVRVRCVIVNTLHLMVRCHVSFQVVKDSQGLVIVTRFTIIQNDDLRFFIARRLSIRLLRLSVLLMHYVR